MVALHYAPVVCSVARIRFALQMWCFTTLTTTPTAKEEQKQHEMASHGYSSSTRNGVAWLQSLHVPVVCSVAHEVCVADVVFHHTAAQNDHAGVRRIDGHVVDGAHVADDVDDEAGIVERMEIDHVSDASVCQRGTEHLHVVLVTLVQQTRLVVLVVLYCTINKLRFVYPLRRNTKWRDIATQLHSYNNTTTTTEQQEHETT
jgi:hypothetical protein